MSPGQGSTPVVPSVARTPVGRPGTTELHTGTRSCSHVPTQVDTQGEKPPVWRVTLVACVTGSCVSVGVGGRMCARRCLGAVRSVGVSRTTKTKETTDIG